MNLKILTILTYLTIFKTIQGTCGVWDTDYNSYNWEPEFITIFVTWQSRVIVDRIRNSWDVFLICVFTWIHSAVSYLHSKTDVIVEFHGFDGAARVVLAQQVISFQLGSMGSNGFKWVRWSSKGDCGTGRLSHFNFRSIGARSLAALPRVVSNAQPHQSQPVHIHPFLFNLFCKVWKPFQPQGFCVGLLLMCKYRNMGIISWFLQKKFKNCDETFVNLEKKAFCILNKDIDNF